MPPRRRQAGLATPSASVRATPPSAWMRLAPAVVVLAALLSYANSLSNGFVWDDPIILSRQLVVFRTVGDVLAPPRDIPQFSPDYYRPLTIATYLLDRAVGGDSPFAFHLSVVLSHAATSLLVYLLALQLLRSGPRSDDRATLGALAAGALFAVHPIHTESVAWAAGRSDVLATGFLIAALVLTGRTAARPPNRASAPAKAPASSGTPYCASMLAGVCALAALCAKETAVALYPLMFLRELLVPSTPRPTMAGRLRVWSGPLLAGVVYVLLRRNALGEFVGTAPDALPPGQRTALQLLSAVGVYVGRLLWPVQLNAYIDRIDTGAAAPAFAVALAAGVGLASWICLAARRSTAADSVPPAGLPLFALAWLSLTLAPSLAIMWKIPDAPLAERYLYLPSVGFCLLVGDLFARLWAAPQIRARRWMAVVGASLLLLVCALATVRRNPVWHDDIALWEDTESKSTASGMAARSVGTAYLQAGRRADARAAFERALQRRNSARGLQTIYNNLGTLAMYDADYTAAQRHYEAALQSNPGADTLFNLGLAILQRGGMSREAAQTALPYYQRAKDLSPHDPDIEAAMAQAYQILGENDRVAQHAHRALELGASGPTADSLRAMLGRDR